MASSRVVVGTDGTGRSLRAVTWAAQEASLRGCPLRIVHTLPRYEGDFPLFPPGRFEAAEARGHEIVEEAVALVRATNPEVELSTDLPLSTPAVAMIEESRTAREIVLGGKGEDVGNLLMGSTVLQVVGHVAVPVVVVTHVAAGHDLVVVGTDGSPDATAAVAFALQQASLRGARLEVISALDLPQGWPRHLLRPLPPDDDEVVGRRARLNEQVESMRAQHPEVEVLLSVHRAPPVQTLVDASHRADLLVLGSRGRGGFHGLAVGSTTHTMLHLAGCPLAVVRAAP